MAWKYMTKALEKQFPEWMSTDGMNHADIIVQAHFFSPYSGWDWYAWEYDGEYQQLFGLVFGHEVEAGYFSLAEFRASTAMNGKLRLVERDLHWKPIPLTEIPRYEQWVCAQ